MASADRSATDLLIIGAGPAGLHAAFYAALRGLSVRVMDAQSEAGGQLSALYPDKVVYDLPGLPSVRASDIVTNLLEQLAPFEIDWCFNEMARTLWPDGEHWRVESDHSNFAARAVIVAAGMGALLAREVALPGHHPDLRSVLGLAQELAGKTVLVIGGVPQATRAALELAQVGARVTLTHRRALFRGSPAQLAALELLRAQGRLTVVAPAEVLRLTPGGAELSVSGQPQEVQAEVVLVFNGHLPDLAPLRSWPLNWQGEYIPAQAGGATALRGVFAAGDVREGAASFKLLSVALAEAALAANHAAHHARPELKVKPGHSSDRRLPQREGSR